MSSKRYRKKMGQEKVAHHASKFGWARRAFLRKSRELWLYGASIALVIGFIVQHLVHEMMLDIVVYASSADTSVSAWADQLRAAGYHVHINQVSNPDRVRRTLGVPSNLAACHTAIAVQSHFVLEGDVPPEHIKDLLATQPNIAGLAAIRDSQVGATDPHARRVVAFVPPLDDR